MTTRDEPDSSANPAQPRSWRPARRDRVSNDAPPGADELMRRASYPRGSGPGHASRSASSRHSDPAPPDLASFGYAGQGYPIYGEPSGLNPDAWRQRAAHEDAPDSAATENTPPRNVSRHSAGLESSDSEDMPAVDPAALAYASGFTPALPPYAPFVSPDTPPERRRSRGPIRPDARIREDVCARLSHDDEIDASDISVSVARGEVLLEGCVSDRHDKRLAEDIARSVRGVREVQNELRPRKGFLRELTDKLSGDDTEHRGHRGSGTRNEPTH